MQKIGPGVSILLFEKAAYEAKESSLQFSCDIF